MKTSSGRTSLLGGFLCMFSIGLVYTWSLYVNPIVEKFGYERNRVTLTFSILTMTIPIVMIFASKLYQKIGATKTALLGVVLLIAGYLVSSFSNSLISLYLGFGILCGAGVGVVYGVPIPTVVKWFPNRKGMVSGIMMTAYGAGPIVLSNIFSRMISTYGPSRTFIIHGCIAAVCLLIGAPLLKSPPEGYVPEGAAAQATSKANGVVRDFTTSEMLRRKQFWALMIMYIIANVAGLFITGHASPMSQAIAGITAMQAATIVSLISICSTVGRFISGFLTDKLGTKAVMSGIFALYVVLFFILRFGTSFASVAVILGLLGACFGGMMAVYPPVVMNSFGSKYYSTNYAVIFLAYGFGGLIGNAIASFSLNNFGGYTMAFTIFSIACAVAFVLAILYRRPKDASLT